MNYSSNERIVKALSDKTRYEVFERDSFKCQYCGRSAPDVILEVDHMLPVSKGGGNEVYNLITSCRKCNRGKSNKIYEVRVNSPIGQHLIESLGLKVSIFAKIADLTIKEIIERGANK